MRWGVIIALALWGCVEEGGLQIFVESNGIDEQGLVDEITVDVVASLTSDTSPAQAVTCAAVSRSWPIDDADFPITIVLKTGTASWRCVAIRVTGTREGDAVVMNEDLLCPDLETLSEATLWLDDVCHVDNDPPWCDVGQVCRAVDDRAACVQSNVGAIFDVTPAFGPCDGSDL